MSKAQHFIIMPVVSADGVAWSPLSLPSGKHAKFQSKRDGTIYNPSTFLPAPANCVYREKEGFDTARSFSWGKTFEEETAALQVHYENIVRAVDGYGAHVLFDALQVF